MNGQRRLLNRMKRGANAYNSVTGDVVVEEVTNIPVTTGKKLVTVGQGLYNPPFKAQIQLAVLKFYFTEAADVYTPILPAALAAQLKVALPFFAFSNSDAAAGFAKLQGQFPLGSSGWTYQAPVVYGKDYPASAFGLWDVNVTALLRAGDLVIPFTAVTAGPVNTMCLVVLRTNDVPYATLLDATNSNKFKLNLIRYTVTLGQETQFANEILCSNETMFGKFESDPLNPEAFKNPEQQQNNIIDIDSEFEINKQTGLSSQTLFDVVSLRWNLFIEWAVKI